MVLFVDDEDHIRHAVKQGLELAGIAVECFDRPEPLLERLSRSLHGVVVSDLKMPGMDGTTLMQHALEIDASLPVVLVTGHGDVPMAVDAMRAGAYDFIEKPFDTTHLAEVVGRAIEKRRLVLENRALRNELGERTGLEAVLVGKSAAIQRLREQVAAVAATEADVLVIGETGSGKEVVARALHQFGPRREGPFVAMNCGAMPAEIIESELFGHEAGAFTGATKQRIGKLEHASGGTVFLDEIESMPLDLQVKLLRLLEERSVVRLGANQPIPLDLRFIAATKLDLEAASKEGRFRADLHYRLNVVSLQVPSLRERKEDLELLVHHLAREAQARYRKEIPTASPSALAALVAHDWPGNVRELRNAVDRFVLGLGALEAQQGAGTAEPEPGAGFVAQMDSYEKSLLSHELARHQGNLKATYESLGLSRKTLYDKMQKHGLRREDYLPDPKM